MAWLKDCPSQHLDILNLDIPLSVSGVDSKYLNPRNTWQNRDDYDLEAFKLAQLFTENMTRFSPSETILAAGPQPVSEIVEKATVA
jgi:phosphoenolpyruvate carboxykinase (ATP)